MISWGKHVSRRKKGALLGTVQRIRRQAGQWVAHSHASVRQGTLCQSCLCPTRAALCPHTGLLTGLGTSSSQLALKGLLFPAFQQQLGGIFSKFHPCVWTCQGDYGDSGPLSLATQKAPIPNVSAKPELGRGRVWPRVPDFSCHLSRRAAAS